MHTLNPCLSVFTIPRSLREEFYQKTNLPKICKKVSSIVTLPVNMNDLTICKPKHIFNLPLSQYASFHGHLSLSESITNSLRVRFYINML